MSDVLSVAPEKKSKVSELKAEHRQFSKSLEEIMNALKGMHKKDPDKLEQIRIRLDEIIITIRQHEEEEHRRFAKSVFLRIRWRLIKKWTPK